MGIETNAQAVADHWAERLGASGPKITSGVNRVQTSPGAMAAQKKDKYLANVQASVDKWAANVGAVSLEDWRAAMVSKGIPRIGAGASAAKPKFAAFMGRFLPFLSSATEQTRRLPDTSFEERLQRMTAQARAVHGFKNRG